MFPSYIWFPFVRLLLLWDVVSVEGVAKTFYFHTQSGTPNAAEQVCSSYNASMVTISSKRDYEMLLKLMEDHPEFIGGSYWIGLFHTGNDVFSWACSDLVGLSFANWGENQPGVYGASHCVEVRTDNLWYSSSCHSSYKFICEKREGPCAYSTDVSFSTYNVTSMLSSSLVNTLLECQTKCENFGGGESCFYFLGNGTTKECILLPSKPSTIMSTAGQYTGYSRDCYSGVSRTELVPYVSGSGDPPNTRCPKITIPSPGQVTVPSLNGPTVASPDDSTTAFQDESTAASLDVPPTSFSGESTTTSPGVSTTASPDVSTSSSGVSTTASPDASTTASLDVSPTSFSGESTTASPGVSTTASLDVSTTASLDVSTTSFLGESTTASPGVSTTTSPGVSTTASPGVSTTTSLDVSTTSFSAESTTACLGVSTTDVSTTSSPDVSTIASLEHTTVTVLDDSSTTQSTYVITTEVQSSTDEEATTTTIHTSTEAGDTPQYSNTPQYTNTRQYTNTQSRRTSENTKTSSFSNIDTTDNSAPTTQLNNYMYVTTEVVLTSPDSPLSKTPNSVSLGKNDTPETSTVATTAKVSTSIISTLKSETLNALSTIESETSETPAAATTTTEVFTLWTTPITYPVSSRTMLMNQSTLVTSGLKTPSQQTQDHCYCPCTRRFYSDAEKGRFIRKILEDLSLGETTIGAHVRRLTSAPDPRPSAKVIGCTGLVFLAVAFFSIVSLDLATLFRDFQKLKENVKMLMRGNSLKELKTV